MAGWGPVFGFHARAGLEGLRGFFRAFVSRKLDRGLQG